MKAQDFLRELDVLFSEKKINKVEPYLTECMNKARELDNKSLQFTILNEMMGFFRDTSQYEKSLDACNKCLTLMKTMKIEGSVDYATALQNIANAYRAAGRLDKSLNYYKESFSIYEKTISAHDYRMAGINNNIALLYQEMKDYENSVVFLQRALEIIVKIENAEIETAVTYTNLGSSLLELNKVDEAIGNLNKAMTIFNKDDKKDFHYSAALSAMALAKCKLNKYEEAAKLYEEALKEIEINMGRGTAYNITQENLLKIYHKLANRAAPVEEKLKGLALCIKFYEEIGAPMIHEKFLNYESKIAVGLVGEGSECFGFDDEYSVDHDFGPGFCMWVTEETYEAIGEALQEEYDKLPTTFMGVTRENTKMANGRTGVQIIGDFYEKYTGYRKAPSSINQWIELEDYKLSTVTNGLVFRDDEEKFTDIRNGFTQRPEVARKVKIAREAAATAQTGQYNYSRSMARRDYVTANICISEFMQHTMKMLYLLNYRYAPYYKWMYRGAVNLKVLPEITDILRAVADMPDQREAWKDVEYDNTKVNENDMKALTVEIIAKLVINELYNENLIDKSQVAGTFLDDYAKLIMKKIDANDLEDPDSFSRNKLIDRIVWLEFDAFDKVKNKDGRAECQSNWKTFEIMRKSQYMTWTDSMLKCIYKLWKSNKKSGWNMMTEKYARMMESTAKDEYNELREQLPEKSEQTVKVVNHIVQIQVDWMKSFAEKYPKLGSNARNITHESDDLNNTSYETYLRGELLTYSEQLLKLYGQFIVALAQSDRNLAEITMQNTVNLWGYKSLKEAEESL